MRVAIVTDGIWVYGGAERVLESMLQLYPQAELHALVDYLPEESKKWLGSRKLRTSFLQSLPGSRRYFRSLLSLWPLAIEQTDLSGYDLVISSQFAVAHGVITGPGQVHVAYTHSPARYAWDLQANYLREAGMDTGWKTILARPMLHRLRMWDATASLRPDEFAANSAFVAARIKKYYRRDCSIIHPPVFVDRFTFREKKDDFYLYLGRLVAYKRVDIIVQAFAAMPDRQLVIAGDGPCLRDLQRIAPKNVRVLGHVDAKTADDLMGRARGYVYAAIEDFGIAPLEAQAAGTPVIGLGIGGLCETIRPLNTRAPTGVLFGHQTVDSLVAAIEQFERVRAMIHPADCRANALRFSPAHFQRDFAAFVETAVARHGAGRPATSAVNLAAIA